MYVGVWNVVLVCGIVSVTFVNIFVKNVSNVFAFSQLSLIILLPSFRLRMVYE